MTAPGARARLCVSPGHGWLTFGARLLKLVTSQTRARRAPSPTRKPHRPRGTTAWAGRGLAPASPRPSAALRDWRRRPARAPGGKAAAGGWCPQGQGTRSCSGRQEQQQRSLGLGRVAGRQLLLRGVAGSRGGALREGAGQGAESNAQARSARRGWRAGGLATGRPGGRRYCGGGGGGGVPGPGPPGCATGL